MKKWLLEPAKIFSAIKSLACPMRISWLVLALLPFFAPDPLRAQFNMTVGMDPSGYGFMDSTGPTKTSIDPYAQALAQELLKAKPTTYWQAIDISSSQPAKDLDLYVKRGFGRSELITLLLIAEGGKQKLSDLAKKRVQGARLRELAVNYKLDYETVRSQAEAFKKNLVQQINIKSKSIDDGTSVSGSTETQQRGNEPRP